MQGQLLQNRIEHPLTVPLSHRAVKVAGEDQEFPMLGIDFLVTDAVRFAPIEGRGSGEGYYP